MCRVTCVASAHALVTWLIMTFSMVVAIDAKNGIGKDGGLPWHLPGDMKYFRELTSKVNSADRQNVVIMGRKTWNSIPERFRPLSGRINIVLTRNNDLQLPMGVLRAGNFKDVEEILDNKEIKGMVESAFVIGGQQIFEEAMRHPGCGKIYMTHILKSYDCDTFLPTYDAQFEKVTSSPQQNDDSVSYYFAEYERKIVD